VFTLQEMVAAFDVVDVNSNPARFDQKKADAINAEHIRRLPPEEFARRLKTFFAAHGHDTGLGESDFVTAAELVQTRVVVLSDGWELLKFLNDDGFAIDAGAGAKELTGDAVAVLDSALGALGALDGLADWTAASIEEALKGALIDGLGLKPRKAFGPIRVAVTGATVSPPLYESMELLGRDRSMQRLREARDGAARNLW
jgi:glutamyl-tRNA synthetase